MCSVQRVRASRNGLSGEAPMARVPGLQGPGYLGGGYGTEQATGALVLR